MAHILGVSVSLPNRDFLLGGLSGVILTIACFGGLVQFGIFPKESEALILSADYRLSRTEIQLREQVRYLEHELDLLRRTRSSTVSYPGRTGS